MGSLKKQPPKALAWRHTLTHAAATEGVLVGWMLAARKRPGRPGPFAAKGAASGSDWRGQRSKPPARPTRPSDRPTIYGVRAEARCVLEASLRVKQTACRSGRLHVDRVAVVLPPGCSEGKFKLGPLLVNDQNRRSLPL